MKSRRTWIVVLSVALGCVALVLAAAAGAGVYFVSRHIRVEPASDAAATRALQDVRARFGDAQPLFSTAPSGRRLVAHPVPEAHPSPTGRTCDDLHILAWDPDSERLVRASLPLWVLRYGHQRFRLKSHAHDFDLSDLNLDVQALERAGPALLVDHRDSSGHRVVVWTE